MIESITHPDSLLGIRELQRMQHGQAGVLKIKSHRLGGWHAVFASADPLRFNHFPRNFHDIRLQAKSTDQPIGHPGAQTNLQRRKRPAQMFYDLPKETTTQHHFALPAILQDINSIRASIIQREKHHQRNDMPAEYVAFFNLLPFWHSKRQKIALTQGRLPRHTNMSKNGNNYHV
jgi:hypothetical protein